MDEVTQRDVSRIRATLLGMIENRTAAATRARMRASEEKAAARLRERGWTVTPPQPQEKTAEREKAA